MRKIKFRAWSKKTKEWLDTFHIILGTINAGWDVEYMQYTGLKDKNGKEIYEGDIDSRGLVVEYLIGMSGYYLMKNGEGFHLSHDMQIHDGKIKDLEIIGNAWENPELKEATNA